jgi:hypothetical protein
MNTKNTHIYTGPCSDEPESCSDEPEGGGGRIADIGVGTVIAVISRILKY